MNKISVIPAEGFTVKDHKGNVIPEEGAEVIDSPVVQRRLREGLLIAAGSATAADPQGGEDPDFEAMTKAQLQGFLKENEIEFPASANKADLLAILDQETEAAE